MHASHPFADLRLDALTPGRAHAAAQRLLASRRDTFGSAVMELEDPPADAGADDKGGTDKGAEGGPNGFPEATPIAQMTPEQQAAYWKHQARKHEDTSKARADYDSVKTELDRLKAASLTDAEKAAEAAKLEGRTTGEVEARNRYVPQLVAAKLEAALAGKMPADKIAGQVEFLDHAKFLTDAGEVDTDKVKQYAAGITPTGGTWPDMGGGKRGKSTADKGVTAGADMYAASRGKKTT